MCTPPTKDGNNYIVWVYQVLGECAYSTNEQLSVYITLIAILLNVFTQAPFAFLSSILQFLICYQSIPRQFLMNFYYGNANSLSITYLLTWWSADAVNFVGVILTNQLPSQIVINGYYVLMDTAMLVQWIFYAIYHKVRGTNINNIKTRKKDSHSYELLEDETVKETLVELPSISAGTTETDQVLYDPADKSGHETDGVYVAPTVVFTAAPTISNLNNTETSSSSSGGGSVALAPDSVKPEPTQISLDEISDFVLNPSSSPSPTLTCVSTESQDELNRERTQFFVRLSPLLLGSIAVYLLYYVLDGDALQQIIVGDKPTGRKLLAPHPAGIYDFARPRFLIGYILGCFSAVLYIAAPFAQIIYIFNRKSVIGLSLTTFILVFLANFASFAAIPLFSVKAIYLAERLPWIVGNLVPTFTSAFLIVQLLYYRYNERQNRKMDDKLIQLL